MRPLKYKTVLNLILVFSIFSILFAFYVEYILGHKPCNLCLLQRLPYIATIMLIVLVMVFKNLEKTSFLFLSLIFLAGSLLAIYHVGIERGLISESFLCGNNIDASITDKSEILKQLQNRVISCKDVTFAIFGISLATINTFISAFLTIITLLIFIRYEKKR